MSTTAEATEIDTDKLMSFVFRAVDEVGATLNAALVVMGDKLGYYRDLADARPDHAGPARRAHADRRAVRAGVAERPGRRRLRHLRPRDEALHAAARARARDDRSRQPGVPARASSRSPSAPCTTPQHIVDAARSGAGYGWHQHDTDVHVGCERFFRPSYHANLVDSWIPALDGVEEKLETGALVADVGCGHGASTILLAQAFPNSTFVGLRLPRRVDRDGARPRRGGGRRRTRALRGRVRRRSSAAAATTWSRCSTACTTWATRSAPRGTCARRSPTTAPG